jgi:hypothetical protein
LTKVRPDWAYFRRFLLPLLLGALLALPASAMAAETGSITGAVSAEGGPIAGEVEVCAKSVLDENIFKCAWVDGSGPYVITELPAGKYKVGFWPTGNYVTRFWEGGLTWNEATAVPVAAGLPTPDIEAVLEVGATISGAVTAAATGAPVGEVEACAILTELERCAKANAAGQYVIDGLVEGTWNVYFDAQEANVDVVSPQSPTTVMVGPKQNVGPVDAALIPGGQIAGTVRLAGTGAPVGGVLVCATMASSSTPLTCLRTPSSGAYRFTRVWPGSFKVVFSPEPKELFDPEHQEEAEAIEREEAAAGYGPDSYPTEWWGGQSTFAAAVPIEITPPAIVNNIDASLVGPPTPAPVTPTTTPVVKKPLLNCKRGFVKRKVHGKQRCVKRHKAKPKPRHSHHKAKHHAPQSPLKRP